MAYLNQGGLDYFWEKVKEYANSTITVSPKEVSGSIATFDDGSETPVKSLSVNIEPVQAGSGDPSPENVRPISGWDAVNVTVCGKNLFDKNAITNNVWISSGSTELEPNPSYVTSDYIRVSKGDKIWMPQKTSNRCAYYDFKKQGIEYFAYGGNTVLSVAHDGYIRVTIFKDIDLDAFQIIKGTAEEPYEPYKGTVYPISLPQTVYGGALDVGKGKLTVTKAYGSAESCSEAGGFFYIRLPNSLVRREDIIMDKLAYQNAPRTELRDNRFSVVGGAETAIWIKIAGLSTLAEYNAYLAENPIHYVTPLATPLTINLTPTEVRTILGYNNIYADSGEVSVVYCPQAAQKPTIEGVKTSTISVPTGTETDLLDEAVAVKAGHSYAISYAAQFAANSTGYRRTKVYVDGTDAGVIAADIQPAVSGAETVCRGEHWFAASSNGEVMIKGLQNSGGALFASTSVRIIDLGN